MKAIRSYLSGCSSIWKYRYPIVFLYLANVVFTFIVTSPFTIYFKNKMAHTNVLDGDEGFNLEMVGEFLTNYGEGLQPLMTLLILVIGFFFIFSVYSNAAILYAVSSKNNYIPIRSFWNGGLNYFWKVLRLSVYYIISLIIVAIVVWKVLLMSGINVLEVYDDSELAFKFKVGLIIMAVLFGIFSIVKQYAKILIAVKNQPFITGAIVQSGAFTFRRMNHTLLLYAINLLGLLFLFIIYISLRNAVHINLWLVTFFFAQIFLITKIIIRVVHLHSSFDLYLKLNR